MSIFQMCNKFNVMTAKEFFENEYNRLKNYFQVSAYVCCSLDQIIEINYSARTVYIKDNNNITSIMTYNRIDFSKLLKDLKWWETVKEHHLTYVSIENGYTL